MCFIWNGAKITIFYHITKHFFNFFSPTVVLPLPPYSAGHEVPPKKSSGPPQLPKIRGPMGDLNASWRCARAQLNSTTA